MGVWLHILVGESKKKKKIETLISYLLSLDWYSNISERLTDASRISRLYEVFFVLDIK